MTEEAQNKDGRRWFKGSLNYWKISQRKRDEFSLSGLSLFSSAEDVSDLELIKISHTTAPKAHVVGGERKGGGKYDGGPRGGCISLLLVFLMEPLQSQLSIQITFITTRGDALPFSLWRL